MSSSAASPGGQRARHYRIACCASPGAGVSDVSFTDAGVLMTVRLRRRRRVCAECAAANSRSTTTRQRWRHLDLGSTALCDRARATAAALPDHLRVRLEPDPVVQTGRGAYPRVEDVVAWPAQQMAFAPIRRC